MIKIKLGFTSIVENGLTKPQCVLFNVVLSVEAVKPSKLKRHLNSKHPQHAGKDLSFFQRNKASLQRQKLDSQGYFQQQNKALVEASYETAFAIAKQTKPYSIKKNFVGGTELRNTGETLCYNYGEFSFGRDLCEEY